MKHWPGNFSHECFETFSEKGSNVERLGLPETHYFSASGFQILFDMQVLDQNR